MTLSLSQSSVSRVALLMAVAALAACSDDPPPAGNDAGVDANVLVDGGADAGGDASTAQSIAAIASANPDFSMLVAAATRASLVTLLDSPGNYTVFAPTNAAFTASGITMEMINTMPTAQLTGILSYHALDSVVPSTAITAGPVDTLSTFSIILGTTGGVTINGGNSVAGGANVVTADIAASNGIIHVIDRVLMPPTVADLARYAGLTSLHDAVVAAALDDELSATGPFTVFAPTNAAFAELSAVPTGEALVNVLLYHVVSGSVASSAVPAKAASLSMNQYGDPLTLLFNTASGVSINGSVNVVIADVHATNGIVHVVDEVLLPMNVVDAATAAGLTGLLGAVTAASEISAGVSVADALGAQAPYTVFAPTNAAFTAIESTLSTLTADQVRDVLLYHVLDTTAFPAPVLAADLPATVTDLQTLLGPDASFDPTVTPPTIDGAQIVTTDIIVTNGVVHVVGSVLLPPS
ncbi:MAG: fasciclin domain-containing protein [Sandaracinaceae bacterium]|jgi:transforming growth factor-beta-induced protein|nr:fasciclin domain-containing protein [Sandaracinaceae bacterium]